ncbi:unnamed protein product, partial [Symbiodinium microadriaticum]
MCPLSQPLSGGPGNRPQRPKLGRWQRPGSSMPRPVKPETPAACDHALVEVRRQQE